MSLKLGLSTQGLSMKLAKGESIMYACLFLGRYSVAFIRISKASLIKQWLRTLVFDCRTPPTLCPRYKFPLPPRARTARGHILVTKSLKAELPKALALD